MIITIQCHLVIRITIFKQDRNMKQHLLSAKHTTPSGFLRTLVIYIYGTP